jgi:hypothetical protein
MRDFGYSRHSAVAGEHARQGVLRTARPAIMEESGALFMVISSRPEGRPTRGWKPGFPVSAGDRGRR